ncbi:unnamed protein product, partial [Oppiella nova]
MVFAVLGMTITAFIILVFWIYSSTPIIKAAGRELSYLLLIGIFMSFSMTFVIVAKPTPWTCGRRRSCTKPKYTSPQSQLVITGLLISLEIIINVCWLFHDKFGTMVFAVLGMTITAFIILVFWIYSSTPIIKAAGRELSYLLLMGIFMSFSMTFVIVAKPTPWTCGRRRSCTKPKYTSPQSQLVITGLLISLEIIINVCWLFHDKPDVTHVYPTREDNILICLGSDNTSYLVGLIYPSILIGFCTAYAFKTRKCPEGFNEARYLTFTNYTTCVIWLAFLPLFVLSTSTAIRSVTLSCLLSLSGAVQIACLFVPKVYIALLKPEKNTKENVMCSHSQHFNRNRATNYTQTSASSATHANHNNSPTGNPSIMVNGGKPINTRTALVNGVITYYLFVYCTMLM